MIVIEGELIALLPGETEWKSYEAGAFFEVGANVKFKVKSVGQSSYLYIKSTKHTLLMK